MTKDISAGILEDAVDNVWDLASLLFKDRTVEERLQLICYYLKCAANIQI